MASHGVTLTDELADALAQSVSKGVPIETATRAAGISPSTFYSWLSAGKTGQWGNGGDVDEQSKGMLGRFVELIGRAEAEFEAKQVQRLAEAAEAVNEKTGLTDWRARAWLLNNHPRTRERYRQHKEVQIESNSTVTHEHKMVAGLTYEQLDALENDLKALPGPTDT